MDDVVSASRACRYLGSIAEAPLRLVFPAPVVTVDRPPSEPAPVAAAGGPAGTG